MFTLVSAGVAWGQSSSNPAPPPLPTTLWLSPLAGLVAAMAVIVPIAYEVQASSSVTWSTSVTAESAWSAADSWVTNLSALGSAIVVVLSTGALSSFLPKLNPDGFAMVALLYGGSAAMAPVMYGALAAKPSAGQTTPNGSVAGVLLASTASLLAAFGLVAESGQVLYYTSATGPEKWPVYAGLVVAAAAVAVYGYRSVNDLVFPPDNASSRPSFLAKARSGTL